MRLKFIIGVIFVLLYGCKQESKIKESNSFLERESQPVIALFFKALTIENDSHSAIMNLLNKNENIDLQDSLTIDLENKFDAINRSSGKLKSYRLLRKKELGNDIGIYAYLVKYDKKFYRFIFTFYNNGTQIEIYKFSFDDTIDIEMEEALKLYSN
ncbi:MAG: hypothetical protein JST21_02345 [Bacteroidetes bacterium]|jgi:hypothetical protein|nr:hypothetical protein [Bacteroidota bacterium]